MTEFACGAEGLAVFNRISSLLISDDRDLNNVMDAILLTTMQAVGADRAFIAMVDYEHGELAVRYTAGRGWSEPNMRLRLKVSQESGRGITGHVAVTSKPYRTGDVQNDPYYISHFSDVMSEVAVPICDSHGRTQGVINIESSLPDAFGEEHEAFLCVVADLTALRLNEDRQRKRQAALVSFGREIGRFARTAPLLQEVIRLVSEAIRFQDCSIFLFNKEHTALMLEASLGDLRGRIRQAQYAPGEGITGWVAQHGAPVRTSDPRTDPRWRGLHEEVPPEKVGGLIAAPIVGYEHVLGVLRVLRRRSEYAWVPNNFTEEDEEFVAAMASMLGATIDSAELVKRLMAVERMAAWGEMSARSAHMIGNRVFAIKGDLNELRHVMSECCTKEGMDHLVDSLEKGVFRLEEILAEFREFVVATRLSTQPIEINQLVREAVEEAFPRHTGVRLEMELAENLPPVDADATKLRRCFSELVENSFNFQQDEGFVRVRTERYPETGGVRVLFEDHGPGIPEENKKLVFRPFFSTRSKGMGLGLSIVKGIIDAHNGTIRETGKEGEGARFEIVLPAADQTQADSPETSGSEQSREN